MNITYEKVQDLSATVLLRFQQGLEGYKPVSTEIAPEIVSTGIGNIYPLGRVPAIREWIGDRQVEQIGEAKYMLENKLFESTITVPRTALEDDNYGFYLYQTTAQAKEAQQHPDVMLATAIMEGFSTGLAFDGVSFFSAAHP
jgi:phage major head subunit gpT-like protein